MVILDLLRVHGERAASAHRMYSMEDVAVRKFILALPFLFASMHASGQTPPPQGCPGVPPWVFDDVAASDPFCPFVTEMAMRGITTGCQVIDANHRLFCPNSALTRGAMAAFLARFEVPIRVNAVRTGNYSSGPAAALVPLTGAGATLIQWIQLGPAQRILTYSAECSVDAPAGNNFAWLDLDIVVNGAVVAPTAGTADTFCSADGTAGFGGYTRASITVVIDTITGANTVQIYARGNAGATGVWLGDSALVIH